MEALESLGKEGTLKVTRVAGAIVGEFFAAGIPISNVKTYLEGGDG
jgi:hypothetical protein